MGKRARLQRLPSFRAAVPVGKWPAERPTREPAPHQVGGWRHDALDEELNGEDCGYEDGEWGRDEVELEQEEFLPCNEIETLVSDWSRWSEPSPERSLGPLVHTISAKMQRELRSRVAPGTALPCPEVSDFARRHGIEPDAPSTTLEGLALRALRRRELLPVDPVGAWPALCTALLDLLARAPGEVVANEVGVLAFHEAREQAPSSIVRLLAQACWHQGWSPLALWLLPREVRDDDLGRWKGSWQVLRRLREAQRAPRTHRLFEGSRGHMAQHYQERALELLERGGGSLQTPDYPSFTLAVGSARFTCRPMDKVALAQDGDLGPSYGFLGESLLRALIPQYVFYGLFDEQGRRMQGHVAVFEAFCATAEGDFVPTLGVEPFHDPLGTLRACAPDLLVLLEGVARSRGLEAPLSLATSEGWGAPKTTWPALRRVQEGEQAWLSAADPVVWRLYNHWTGHAWYRFMHAIGQGNGGRRRRPDPELDLCGRAVRLAAFDAGRDEVQADNLEEAFRLASLPAAEVRVTCRDQDGAMVGFETAARGA